MSNSVTNNEPTENNSSDLYDSWGYDTDYYEDLNDDFMEPVDIEVSADPGVPGGQQSVQLNTPEDFRKALQDLENKLDAADLSEKAKQNLLDKLEDAERLVEYTYAESDGEADKTLKDIAKTMTDVSDTMKAAPAAEDVEKQLDDLSKQVAKADYPDGDKSESKWKEALGKMKSELSLDPSEANQKKAKDLIAEIKKGLSDAAAAYKKQEAAKDAEVDSMMKKLQTGVTGGRYNETFILNRLQDVYGDKYDYDHDGDISHEDFSKAVLNGDFPPSPDKKLLKFIYLIDPQVQDALQDAADGPLAEFDTHLADARGAIASALSALFPDKGVAGVPDSPGCVYWGNHKITVIDYGVATFDLDSQTMSVDDPTSYLMWD